MLGQTFILVLCYRQVNELDMLFITCGSCFFALASNGATRSGPIPSGVHDEVLPRNQGEGGDEEDHRTLRTHRKTTG